MTDATPFLPGLTPVAGKPLTAAQDGGNLSSNGGLVVLREIARKLDLAAVVAGPLAALDSRDPSRVLHTYGHMVTARMMRSRPATRTATTSTRCARTRR